MNAATFYSKSGQSPSIDIVNAFKARVLADGGTFEGEDCLIETVKKLRAKGIYQRASLILTPNGFKASKLYSLTANNGTTDFAFTGGGGSRIDSTGNIVAVPPGIPKIDYTNGSCPEIVMERTATNILLYSETLANQTVTMSNMNYILSFYGTGSVTVGENVPVVLNGTSIANRVQIMFLSSGGNKNIIVTGQVKYAQLESIPILAIYYNFPTSWIPTSFAPVTRTISTLQKSGLGELIKLDKGTIIFKLTKRGRGSIFRLDDGTNDNTIRIFSPGDSDYLQLYFSKNGTVINPTISTNVQSEITIAIMYNTSKADFYINGVLYSSLENNNVPNATFNRFSFSSTESMVNRLKYFAYIPSTSTPEELMLYSTPL